MLIGGDIDDLAQCVDTKSFRVHAPSSLLLLCGGQAPFPHSNHPPDHPPSLRDAFLRISHRSQFKAYDILIAEDLSNSFPNQHYSDLLTFESHIAQISELVVVFSESFGSAAELGAFSMSKDISARTLIVIDDRNYGHNSFVRLGPLLALENDHGRQAICVLNLQDLKIMDISNLRTLDFDEFARVISNALAARRQSYQSMSTKEHTTFNARRAGHIIKLIVGLLQHYGALTLDEIDIYLYSINVRSSQDEIKKYLACSAIAGWTRSEQRGLCNYFFPVVKREALQYSLLTSKQRDRAEWRAQIVDYWKEHDVDRFRCIQSGIRLANK